MILIALAIPRLRWTYSAFNGEAQDPLCTEVAEQESTAGESGNGKVSISSN